MSPTLFLFLQAATLGYAIIGGVFIAFSDFIMRSLARTSGTGGVEVMQVINREVFCWVFMALFLGLAPISLGIAAYGLLVVGGSTGILLAAAGLTYFIGCFGVTIAFNVPLNERLAKMELTDVSTNTFWQHTYVPVWTRWNSVRGSACVLSATLMLMAIPGLI